MIGLKTLTMQNIANEELPALVSAARGDPAAFGKLYDRYIQQVYRYLYSRVGNAHEAEDITSQTFITAYESLPKYREQGQFAAWLFRIARSKMNDHFRRNKFEAGLDAAKKISAGEDALDMAIKHEELRRLRVLIERLDENEKELIRLRYVADLSFAEIADLTGKREDAVKKSLYRLLARLKGEME